MLSTKIIISTFLNKRIFTKSLFFRISAIILLFTLISAYIFKLETIKGIGIYSGLFNTLPLYLFAMLLTLILMCYIYKITHLSNIRDINFYDALITFIIILSFTIFFISLFKHISEYNINLINNMNSNTSQNSYQQDLVRY
jgi:hypothetical protein